MGNLFSMFTNSKNSPLRIHVYTGNRKNAGTDAGVQIILHDDRNMTSSPIVLDNLLRNDFERGSIDTFSVPTALVSTLKSPVRISKIEFWKDEAGFGSDWFLDKVEVENTSSNERFVFPIFRWIKSNVHYYFKLLDTCLPQFDDYPEQRKQALEDKRASYELAQNTPGGPVQVKSLPSDEAFDFDYKWDITKMGLTFKAHRRLHLAQHSLNFTSLEEMKTLYNSDLYDEPKDMDKWNDDTYFGMQRVAGVSSSLIYLVKKIPDKFPVTDALLSPFLEGLTIQGAIEKKKLFMCDLAILQGLPTKEGFTVCAPILLLYLDSANHLKPVAIQLQQIPSADNPIFTPSCHPLTWAMVKLWFNNADSTYHQSLAHLGYTHLLMEGVTVTSNRHLSVSHPIYKIIAPHFLYIIAINDRAINKLVAPGEWVDQIMNSAAKGLLECVGRGFDQWRMSVDGTLPEDLKNRGFDSDDVLPVYHYRQDGLLLYEAIYKYVKSYVELYYTTPEMLKDDFELQDWVKEIVKERNGSSGGLGLRGVPGNGEVTTNEQLVQIVTCIIYTCSVAHAATNFQQYDQYGFPPKYPAMLKGTPPTSVTAVTTEQDIVDSLPNREDMLKAMALTKLLSTKGTKSLGDFEVQYVFDPAALKLVNQFRADLEEVGKKIHEYNKSREHKYEYLDPEFIPNSISI